MNNDEELIAWAKTNKKRIAREFIRRAPLDRSDEPIGIITAGLPGAGKTEFTVELLKQVTGSPLRIDMDEIAQTIEGYRPEIANKFRGSASIIMAKIIDEVIKHEVSFVLDGTFAGSRAIENVYRALSHGYQLKIYYIYQHPRVAWDFTQAREKVERRAIDKAGFIESYFNLHENLSNLNLSNKNVTISIILKNENNKIGYIIEDVQDFSQSIPAVMTRIDLESALQ